MAIAIDAVYLAVALIASRCTRAPGDSTLEGKIVAAVLGTLLIGGTQTEAQFVTLADLTSA
jgi:hypothetical protein